MDYQAMQRIPVDPRVINKIQRSPTMRYEQGPDFMGGWGGPARYQQLAGLPMEQRVCYAAILEGITDKGQIEVATGLAMEQIDRGIQGLQTKGLVKVEASEEII